MGSWASDHNSYHFWASDLFAGNPPNQKKHIPYGWIIGGLGIGLALIVFCIVICICLKSSSCSSKPLGEHAKDPDGKSSHKFHILRKSSFCCASQRYMSGKSGDWKQTNGESSSHQITIPKGFYGKSYEILKGEFQYQPLIFQILSSIAVFLPILSFKCMIICSYSQL